MIVTRTERPKSLSSDSALLFERTTRSSAISITALLLALTAMSVQRADAACSVDGVTATCTGDLSEGVSGSSTNRGENPVTNTFPQPPTTTLDIRDLTADITPLPGVAGVALLEREGDRGDDITVTVDTGDFTLRTTGSQAQGIFLRDNDGGDLTTTIDGRIITGSSDAVRLVEEGPGGLTLNSTAQIYSRRDAIEISSRDGGEDVVLQIGGSIRTNGEDAEAIRGTFRGGSQVTAVIDADIDLLGIGSEGVKLINDGNTDVTINGNIVLSELGGDGVEIVQRGDGPILETAEVSVTVGEDGLVSGGLGPNADAIDVRGGDTIRIVNRGTVRSPANNAIETTRGDTTVLNSGTIIGEVFLGGETHTFQNLEEGRLEARNKFDVGAGNALDNAGVLSPGGTGTTNKTVLTGDLILRDTSVFEGDIAADGTADIIEVSGNSTIGGTLALNPQDPLTAFSASQTTDIITSGGGATGTFSAITDPFPDVDFEAVSIAGGQTLRLTPTTAAEGSAVTDKSILANSVQAGLQPARLFTQTLRERPFSDRAERAAIWGSGFAETTDVDGASGYDETTGGLIIGTELARNYGDTRVRGGLAGGWSATDIDGSASDAELETWHVGLHANFETGALRVAGALTYGWQDVEISRRFAVPSGDIRAQGDTDAETFGASLSVSYNIAASFAGNENQSLRIAPTATLDHVTVRQDGYTEGGAGLFNQTVSDTSYHRTALGAGIEVAKQFTAGNGLLLRPSASLMYEHNIGDDEARVNSRIAGLAGDGFSTDSAELGDDAFVVGLGLDAGIGEAITIGLSYGGRFSSEATGHQGAATITVAF